MDNLDPILQRGVEAGQINVAMAVAQLENKAKFHLLVVKVLVVLSWLSIGIGVFLIAAENNLQQILGTSISSISGAVLTLIVMSLGLALTMVKCRWIFTSGKIHNRNRLAKSDLAVSIANRTPNVERILEFTPRLVRFNIKREKSTNFEEVLEHVCNHLNWYLDPPKPYYPGMWIAIYFLWTIMLFIPSIYLITQCLVGICVIPVLLDRSWLSVNSAELGSYLKERLET